MQVKPWALLWVGDAVIVKTGFSINPACLDILSAVVQYFAVIWPRFVVGVNLANYLRGLPREEPPLVDRVVHIQYNNPLWAFRGQRQGETWLWVENN
jgi:hypothetical protein